MPISNINSGGDRNYTDILNSAGKNSVEDLSKKYGITYAKEDNGSLSVKDFFFTDDYSAYKSEFYESNE